MNNENSEINKYFQVLCNDDFPEFILKYLETKELKRLKGIGQFCGFDYNSFYEIKYWFSRFDHSVATALITWNFTKSKEQTLAALFHDLGTPVFSHCVDYMLGDTTNQESAEKKVADIIMNSFEIRDLLELDNIAIADIADVSKYSIVENKRPQLCSDRLEGVLHTVLIWLNQWPLEKVADVYKKMDVLINEKGLPEIGFVDLKTAETFFEAVYEYAMALQSNEDKFTMQYIADETKRMIESGYIHFEDLYQKSEQEIVNIIAANSPTWELFINAPKLERSAEKPQNDYYVSVDAKKRYTIPLCCVDGKTSRLNEISVKSEKLLSQYNNFEDSRYAYIKGIEQFDNQLEGKSKVKKNINTKIS